MNKYYLKLILLEKCPYSMAAYEFIKSKNIPYKKVIVPQSLKHLYKTEKIDTFPQIYINKSNANGNVLIGGYTDLINIYNSKKTYFENSEKLSNKNKKIIFILHKLMK